MSARLSAEQQVSFDTLQKIFPLQLPSVCVNHKGRGHDEDAARWLLNCASNSELGMRMFREHDAEDIAVAAVWFLNCRIKDGHDIQYSDGIKECVRLNQVVLGLNGNLVWFHNFLSVRRLVLPSCFVNVVYQLICVFSSAS